MEPISRPSALALVDWRVEAKELAHQPGDYATDRREKTPKGGPRPPWPHLPRATRRASSVAAPVTCPPPWRQAVGLRKDGRRPSAQNAPRQREEHRGMGREAPTKGGPPRLELTAV